MNLFVERCRGACIGVTGSVGKSTITSMVGHVLTKASNRRVWIGGNIGKSLLDALERIDPADLVVLELSSFQLEMTPQVRWSPHIAVIANVTPNHLDRHGTFAAYLAAKLNILRFQMPGRDVAIVQDAPELRRNFELMFGDVSGLWRYGVDGRTPFARMQSDPASDCDDKTISWPDLELAVPGLHNRLNAAAALTVAHALSIPSDAAVAALASFEALPDRLQRVAVRDGVFYYNDSKSTTPEATLTAMDAVEAPLLLILGGSDKGIDLVPLARAVAHRVKFAACIGQTGPGLAEAILAAGGKAATFDLFNDAVDGCRKRAVSGDAVLLSPACASYDMFEDYRARGAAFTKLAQSA